MNNQLISKMFQNDPEIQLIPKIRKVPINCRKLISNVTKNILNYDKKIRIICYPLQGAEAIL